MDLVTQLQRIYNTLGLISTKGEDTLLMADCLRAMQQLAQQMVTDKKEAESKTQDSAEAQAE